MTQDIRTLAIAARRAAAMPWFVLWAGSLAIGLVCVPRTPVQAGIHSIYSADGVLLVPPPPSVVDHALVDVDNIFVFQERSNFELPINVEVDMTMPGTVNFAGMFASPGTLSAGTRVDSIYVHFDTPQSMLSASTIQIQMDRPILGVIISDELLDATDAILGAPGTLYPNGVEFRRTTGPVGAPMEGLDSVAWRTSPIFGAPPNAHDMNIRMEVEHVLDGVRVLTVPTIPEPAAAVLLATGAIVLVGGYRRR